MEALRRTLGAFGEFLPVKCSSVDLWIYNATRVVDALDPVASSALRFDDGRIMMIQRHVFREPIVSGVDAFRISGMRVSPIYVSQKVVDQWHASGLRGLEFEEVWSPAQ
jgi:hypothetical protein